MKRTNEAKLSQSRKLPEALARKLSDVEANTMRAWEDFVSGIQCDKGTVRDVVAHSWDRCRSSAVDVCTTAAPQLDAERTALLRQRNRDLLQASATTLAEAANMLAGTGSLMLIADIDGVILEAAGDQRTTHAGRDISLWNGGHWHESSTGTNGIGTALVLDKPVLIRTTEHYCESIKRWNCAGVPIHDPVDGSIAGLLDISTLKQIYDTQLLAMAVMAARRIEWVMACQAEEERTRLMESCLEYGQKYAHDGLVALDAKGRVIYVSHKAKHLLEKKLGAEADSLSRGTRILNLGTPGNAVNVDGNGRTLPEVPADWRIPLTLDGVERGTLLVIPGSLRSSPQVSVRARALTDEKDSGRSQFNCIVGSSPAIQTATSQARRLAPLNVPVLIEGETGVGKELFARAIHGNSCTANGPFVAFNCGAVSREMLASELFGYVRGAFTGASNEGRVGRFEQAHGGTLCLDEIGELQLDLQPYLLRVLEEGIIYRVGDNVPRRVSVRLLAMTNRNLRAEVEAGRFRLDLYHRLSVTSIRVPALRERNGDLDVLIDHFNRDIAERHGRSPVRFAPATMDALRAYNWPGNVRELRNLVERAILLSSDGCADLDCLPDEIRNCAQCLQEPVSGSLETAERRIIEDVIRSCSGNLSDAAQVLGISRSTLYRKLTLYGISRLGSSDVPTSRSAPLTKSSAGRHVSGL